MGCFLHRLCLFVFPSLASSATYSFEKSTPREGGFISLSERAEVTKTRLFQTRGDDQPIPGISETHSTFSVVDQVEGSLALSLTGFEPQPLN